MCFQCDNTMRKMFLGTGMWEAVLLVLASPKVLVEQHQWFVIFTVMMMLI